MLKYTATVPLCWVTMEPSVSGSGWINQKEYSKPGFFVDGARVSSNTHGFEAMLKMRFPATAEFLEHVSACQCHVPNKEPWSPSRSLKTSESESIVVPKTSCWQPGRLAKSYAILQRGLTANVPQQGEGDQPWPTFRCFSMIMAWYPKPRLCPELPCLRTQCSSWLLQSIPWVVALSSRVHLRNVGDTNRDFQA